MSEQFHILTVCIGNVCRSPVAERLLRLRLDDHVRRGAVAVHSAGVGAMVDRGIEARALAELERLGGVGDGFAARQISRDIVGAADLVLTATVDIRAKALREDPRALKRTFTLGEFAAICEAATGPEITDPSALMAYAAGHRPLGVTDLDVADPIGRDEAVHRAVADQIDGYVTTIASRLGPLLTGPSPT
jgi:protein-tyrosine phosphatase